MKKIYTTILAAMLGTTAMLAQENIEDYSFYFMHDGQPVANGATITVSEVEYQELVPGVLCMVEMDPKLYVMNTTGIDTDATMVCEGIDNYETIEFCFGQCYSWKEGSNMLTSTQKVSANDPLQALVHIGGINCPTKDYSVHASVKLTLYPVFDEEECVTLTLVFDTNASGVNNISKDKQEVEVFNLCGKKVANTTAGLAKGIYIIRQGNTSRKVTIK